MSRSIDAGHYFQTTDALANSQRRAAKAKNKHGNPIKLPSKILAACLDPSSVDTPSIYAAEAAGEIKRVDLESGKIDRVFTQGTAPLTCVLHVAQPRTLFAGSWDKTIYGVPLDSPAGKDVRRLRGHSDFVKCLLAATLRGTAVLISGGADANVVVWDIATGAQLLKFQSHSPHALQAFALDPAPAPGEPAELFVASSGPEIQRFALASSSSSSSPSPSVTAAPAPAIRAHETSVYALQWDGSGDDLWTASADKCAQRLARAQRWAPDTTLRHPDFVRAVAVFDARALVVTACRDEHVRVWDSGSGALLCVYEGHFDEVTALVPLLGGGAVVSTSIDGTVRRWSLERAEMAAHREAVEREAGGVGDAGAVGAGAEGLLTAEEEAELAELMDEDDE